MPRPKYKRVELGEYIVADQAICYGKPTFKGTRIIVDLAILTFCDGWTIDEIALDYQLPKAAIQEALKLSAQMLREYRRVPAPLIVPVEKLFKENNDEFQNHSRKL
ncbi:DUF433 domain-containing protein [bacterium]|nr:DUF433 domain-containing protein [bacterium]